MDSRIKMMRKQASRRYIKTASTDELLELRRRAYGRLRILADMEKRGDYIMSGFVDEVRDWEMELSREIDTRRDGEGDIAVNS
jgi:hypothetical protein